MMKRISSLFTFLLMLVAYSPVQAENFITVASTTSTQASGLFDYILPKFSEKTGIEVRVVAVGTGQALRVARNGDADVLLVHHRPSEEKFVEEGFGIQRFDVMYNDFVLVGPKADPAQVAVCNEDSKSSLIKIAASKSLFISRGDDSGTHKKERSLWSGDFTETESRDSSWYREAGAGMGATLNMAAASSGYTLTDRATWISFKNKQDLKIVCEGDPVLFNPYGIIRVNEAKHPHVKTQLAQTFVDWIISADGQEAIGSYKLEGKGLFTPSAKP